MNVNLLFDYVGIVVLIILLIYFQRKRTAPIASYKMFYTLLVNLMAVSVLDILAYVYSLHNEVADSLMVSLISVFRLWSMISLFTIFTIYVLCVATIDKNPAKHWTYAIYFPGGLIAAVVVVFAVRQRIIGGVPDQYVDNPVLQLILIAGVLYDMILCIIIGMRYGRMLEMKRNRMAVSAGLFIMLVGAFQYANPGWTLTVFLGTIVMTDLLQAVQKPEEIFEGSDAMKKKYMIESVRMDLERGRKFGMIFVKILDYGVLLDSLGKEDTIVFMRHVTQFLSELKYRALVFQPGSDVLAVKYYSSGKEEDEKLFEDVRERFKEPFRGALMESMLTAGFMRLSCPEDVSDADTFDHMMDNIHLAQMQPGEEFPPKKLLGDDKEKQLLKAIRRALDEDLFEVYYQPIYSTREKKVIAAEALIRLFDPEFGYIHPEPMIAVAEKEGYILRIGEIVFREVCRFYSENRLDKLGIEYIEVNLSAVQCMKQSLADQFIGIMKEYRLKPEQINFEITESSAMINDAEVSRNIESFEKQGVALSLDDYGTGYSNISYLYNLPFMIMKVDKSILWSSEKNEKADIILKNTFRMAKRLNMKVVMEGVETEEQIKKLLTLNCDYFQGYYFSKPVNGDKFIEYIKGFSLPEVCR